MIRNKERPRLLYGFGLNKFEIFIGLAIQFTHLQSNPNNVDSTSPNTKKTILVALLTILCYFNWFRCKKERDREKREIFATSWSEKKEEVVERERKKANHNAID